jgi:hypothetical protein
MQPTYLPWLGYFDLIAQADVFVFLDDVQFERRSWQSRNRIVSSGGEQMLSVSVRKHDQQTALCDIILADDPPWRGKHIEAVRHAYAKRPYGAEAIAFLEAQLAPLTNQRLVDLHCGLIEAAAGELGLKSQFVRASALGCGGTRSEHLLEICRTVGARTYISPMGSRDYMLEDGVFAAAGLPVRFRRFAVLPYTQGREFTPYMSFLDSVANLGWAGAAEHLRQSGAASAYE